MGYDKHKRPILAPGFCTDGAAGLSLAAQREFVSTEQTGTGAVQNIPHGLGVIPTKVFVAVTNSGAAFVVTEGAHTSSNLVLTVTAAAKFKVMAFA